MGKMHNLIHETWNVLPEPMKAAILFAFLNITMAFRNDSRSWKEVMTDTAAGAIIVFIGGSAILLLGLSEGWTFILAGALGGYGIQPTKEFLRTVLERFLHK